MDRLGAIAERFVRAFEAGLAQEVVKEAAAYSSAMEALGNAAGAPIVEERLQRTGELARRFRGAPSPVARAVATLLWRFSSTRHRPKDSKPLAEALAFILSKCHGVRRA